MSRLSRGALEVRRMLVASSHVAARLAEESPEWVETVARVMVKTLRSGGAVYYCGNGGSAAESQHMAAELCGRFYKDRRPLNAASLTVNTSALTALGNDYDYSEVFSRQVTAYGRRGDILVGISTSGKSKNVIEAFKVARRKGMITVGLTGGKGRGMARYCDHIYAIPSEDVARIQEGHTLINHALCARAEAILFPGI